MFSEHGGNHSVKWFRISATFITTWQPGKQHCMFTPVNHWGHHKHFNQLKSLTVLPIFLIIRIQYEQNVMDPGAVKTLERIPLSSDTYFMSCDWFPSIQIYCGNVCLFCRQEVKSASETKKRTGSDCRKAWGNGNEGNSVRKEQQNLV